MPKHIAQWNPQTQLWETDQADLFSAQQEPYSETWPTSGMTRNGQLFPPRTQEHRTAVSASSSSPGLLPTPRTADGMHSTMEANRERMARNRSAGARAWRGTIEEAVSLLKTPTAQLAANGGSQDPEKRKAGGHGPTLADQVEHQLLPTPTANVSGRTGEQHMAMRKSIGRTTPSQIEAAVQLLPTPRATDGTNGGPNQRGSSGDLMLPSAVMQLLPTPMAADGDRQSLTMPRGNPTLVGSLLSTPRASDGGWAGDENGKGARGSSAGWGLRNEVREIASTGEPTRPPSAAGKPSPAAQLPGQLSLDELGSA